jgi:hypothetical protein
MPATLKRVRGEMDVRPAPRDKGLTLTLRVTAYDNGMIDVDGLPINAAPAYDPGHGWLRASGGSAAHPGRVPLAGRAKAKAESRDCNVASPPRSSCSGAAHASVLATPLQLITAAQRAFNWWPTMA